MGLEQHYKTMSRFDGSPPQKRTDRNPPRAVILVPIQGGVSETSTFTGYAAATTGSSSTLVV